MAQLARSVKVQFFSLDRAPNPSPNVDWAKKLTKQSKKQAAISHKYNGGEVHGLIENLSSTPGVSFAVDRATTPRQRDTASGKRTSLRVSPNHEPIEETYVRFFDDNVIGLIQTSTSAPHPAAIALWLNETFPEKNDDRWFINPLIASDTIHRIQNAKEIRKTEFTVPVSDLPTTGFLSTLVGGARGLDPQVKISLTISAGYGQNRAHAQADAATAANEIIADLGRYSAAKVGVVDPGQTASELVNVLADRLSYSAAVPINGRTLSSTSAYAEIEATYDAHKKSIIAAVP
ncbi:MULTISPECIES: hypothetical protein [Tsukamurella]|uniref:Uncharacterized protein n=1 Tax=Tsukamurella asaccharolytica TaxID=2592067 RepID=A0A5C5R7X6_9ACTN|nr:MULTISPECIES: hypothetical protein [Tsukamurella]TWS18423.1 hypothetical protein FK529_15085 [Tsukamurella asaccharolytica]